jgi:hypothetical protein
MMTENESVQAPGTTQPEGAAGTAPAVESAPPKTDADWKRLRVKAERENKTLREQLATLQEAQKTEDQKKLDAARLEGRKEIEGQLAKERIEGAARRALIAEGVDEDLVHVLLAKGEGFDTPDDAAKAAKDYAVEFKARFKIGQEAPRVPGQPGAPSGPSSPSTLTLRDVQKMDRTEYMARAAEINEGIASGRIR